MRKFCALVVAVMLPVCAGQADDNAEAQAAMQQVTGRLLERLHAEEAVYRKDEQRLYRMLEEVVLPVVDMPLFSRLVLGPHWKIADEAQQRRFIGSFQSMLMRSYGKTLLLMSNIELEYEPPPDETGKKYQVVRTRVMTADNKPPLSVNYSLANRGGWKVFDIIIDGTSMAKQFRSGFDQEIREAGLEALLERLSKFDP